MCWTEEVILVKTAFCQSTHTAWPTINLVCSTFMDWWTLLP